MSIFENRRDWLDDFEFKLGPLRGHLAAALDVLTDLSVVLGTHVAYCRVGRDAQRPMPDMQQAIDYVSQAKELVSSAIRHAHAQANTEQRRE
ncbi:MAG: hypothetical protein JNG88_00045 [Phycisphaerales bacterium]|nr:hypothetical protein [Phycisphaerales bacterium]